MKKTMGLAVLHKDGSRYAALKRRVKELEGQKVIEAGDVKAMVIAEGVDKMYEIFVRRLKMFSQKEFEQFLEAKERVHTVLSKM